MGGCWSHLRLSRDERSSITWGIIPGGMPPHRGIMKPLMIGGRRPSSESGMAECRQLPPDLRPPLPNFNSYFAGLLVHCEQQPYGASPVRFRQAANSNPGGWFEVWTVACCLTSNLNLPERQEPQCPLPKSSDPPISVFVSGCVARDMDVVFLAALSHKPKLKLQAPH